jgi:hypothetical protein
MPSTKLIIKGCTFDNKWEDRPTAAKTNFSYTKFFIKTEQNVSFMI